MKTILKYNVKKFERIRQIQSYNSLGIASELLSKIFSCEKKKGVYAKNGLNYLLNKIPQLQRWVLISNGSGDCHNHDNIITRKPIRRCVLACFRLEKGVLDLEWIKTATSKEAWIWEGLRLEWSFVFAPPSQWRTNYLAKWKYRD